MLNKKLLSLLGENKLSITIIVFLNVIAMILNIGIIFSLCYLIDTLMEQYKANSYVIDDYYRHFIAAGVFIFARYILSLIIGAFCGKYERIVKKDLVTKVFSKVDALGNNELFPQINNISINSIEAVGNYLFKYVPNYIISIISPFILFGFTLLICKEASVVLLAFLPLVLICYYMVYRYSKKYFDRDIGKYKDIKDSFQDNVKGIKELKVYQADESYQEKMNSDVDVFRENVKRGLSLQGRVVSIVDFLVYGGTALGIITALFHNNDLLLIYGIGKEAALLLIIFIAPNFLLPLKGIGTMFHFSMEGYIEGLKIYEFLNLPEPIWGNDTIENPTSIEFKNVSFAYPGYDEIIHDVSFKVKKGEIVAVTGKSDSGKSALLSIILGIRKNYGGEVLIGGKDVRTLSKQTICDNISFISDETMLFRTSIRENFRNMNESISDDEINSLLEKVQLKELIDAKGGLGTVIGSSKIKLLKGQKARLKLAINLASTKPIYLIDDLSKKSDVDSEKIILDVISNIGKDKLVLMISSRIRCSQIAKKIYVVQDGIIAEKGTHSSLIKTKGIYKDMYTSQVALEEAYKGGDIDE